jgi:hypothetical protein
VIGYDTVSLGSDFLLKHSNIPDMNDRVFKTLMHSADGYVRFSNVADLFIRYSPDYVMYNEIENDYIIMECDIGCTRKHSIGGMIRAAEFLATSTSRQGVSVFVVKDLDRKRLIGEQFHRYYSWIKSLTNLRRIYILTANEYCQDLNEPPLVIFSDLFNETAIAIS